MGRWTQYDEDEYRLPEGMKRVGYDADTRKYTYKDRDGSFWEGSEGAEFGELTKITAGASSRSIPSAIPRRSDSQSDSDLEASVAGGKKGNVSPSGEEGEIHQLRPASGYSSYNRGAYKTLLPFLLIVLVVLLLVTRLVGSPFLLSPKPRTCGEHMRLYKVKSGDSCWKISQSYATTVDDLRSANPGMDCAKLMPGQKMCVPVRD